VFLTGIKENTAKEECCMDWTAYLIVIIAVSFSYRKTLVVTIMNNPMRIR